MNIKFLIIILFLLLSKISFAGTMTVSGNTDDYCMTRNSTPDVLDYVFRAPLNQGTGSMMRDVSGYGTNGTIYGATWVNVNGRRCLNFDGDDDYATFPYNTATNIEGSKSVSLCAWVYPITQDGGSNDILAKHRFVSGTNRGGFYLQNSGATPDFILTNNSSAVVVTSLSTIGTATWTHICGVYNISTGGSALLYINGTRVAAGTMSSGIGTHTVANIRLSNSSIPANINAYIDDARIYDWALTAEEVNRIYQATAMEIIP